MHRKLSRLIFLTAAFALFGAQCIRFGGGGSAQGSGGGVFKSVDRGAQWQQKTAVPTAAGVKSFGGANVTSLSVDPQDRLAIYAGTRESGMFYSYDGGESWRQPKDIAAGFVSAVRVDPKNKCVVYVATGNKILKSVDCSRTFESIYNDAVPTTFVSALAINPFQSNLLYAGTTKGALIKSTDGGNSWSIQGNLKSQIFDIVVDPRNSSFIYAAVKGKGVWKSTDGGTTFLDSSSELRKIKEGLDVRRIIVDSATPQALLLASKHKVSRSTDGGTTWTALPIISPETVEILALAVNPRNSSEIYYGTATTFYRSVDGGQKWSTEKLPTRRQASALLVDPEQAPIVYLGVLEVKK